MAGSLRQKAARGVLVIGLLKGFGTIISRMSAIVLPLYLLPYDFGLFALASVFQSILFLLGDFGISTDLVRRKERFEEAARTAFTLQLGVGFGLTGLSVLIGIAAAALYREPNLAAPVVVLSLTIVFQAIGMVPRVLATRALDFTRAAVPDHTGKFSAAFLTIGFAVLGLAYWSPVIGTVIGAIIGASLQLALSRWVPRFAFHAALARQIARFGGFVTFAAITSLIAHSIDDAVIGGFLGVAPLGLYTFACSWGLYFPGNISSVITSVTYPLLSRILDTPDRLRRALAENLRYYSYVALCIGLGVIVFAPMFVTALYGAQWWPAILPMQVLVPAGLLLGYSAMAGDALNALGRPQAVFRVNVAEIVLLLVLIPLSTLTWGLLGASFSMVVGVAFVTVVLWRFVARTVGLTRRDWSVALIQPLGAGAVASAVGVLAAISMQATVVSLVVGVLLFSGTFVVALQTITRGRFFADLRLGLRQALR